MLLGAGFPMNPLPVQPAKIHRPPRRDDTLSRERLNSWLDTAAAGRLGLIVAEAGFGKTTLLADWAGLTRRDTTWYRLEPDDRDWLTFIRHLVAAGRELDPEFAPDTFRMLLALGPGGPTPKDLAISIAREMAEFGIASPRGLTLILDDYHAVDGCAETEPIVRALLDRTAPGFSVVIATRSKPTMPMGRIRARGGVMTIAGSDLCFDVQETSRLFRDAYHHPLDEDLVSDLHDRTDGWAALLTLVRTSLEEQDDPRTLVEHLDASRGDLHDFLAEEVLATLPAELQHFLTRVAVLTAVDVETAMLVDERSAEAVAASIRESRPPRPPVASRPRVTAPLPPSGPRLPGRTPHGRDRRGGGQGSSIERWRRRCVRPAGSQRPGTSARQVTLHRQLRWSMPPSRRCSLLDIWSKHASSWTAPRARSTERTLSSCARDWSSNAAIWRERSTWPNRHQSWPATRTRRALLY